MNNSKMIKKLMPLLAIILCSALISGCSSNNNIGEKAYSYLVYFDRNGPRQANSENEKVAADFIVTELESMGYFPQRQEFTEVVNSKNGSITVRSENIICEIKGQISDEIIIAAHYDSGSEGKGTDDNASGVSILLETCFNLRNIQPRYTIRFIFFGAEELGAIGSKYYVKNLGDNKNKILAVLNYDSLIAGDIAYVHGSSNGKGKIRDWMINKAAILNLKLYIQNGLNKEYPEGTTGDWGDQEPFDKIGIEYAAFEATNWNIGNKDGFTQTDIKYGDNGYIWHSKYDSLSYIENTFPGRIKEHLYIYEKLLMMFIEEYSF